MSRELHIGFDRSKVGAELKLKAPSMLRHVMALGSSGSGKTVFSKVVVEEMTALGIPAICIDPQGDICSLALAIESGDEALLAEKGVSPELAQVWRERVEVVVFTPASRRGVPICADPFTHDPSELPARERLHAISAAASMLVTLLGFDLSSDHGEGLSAAFDATLTQWADEGRYPRSLEAFSSALTALDDAELERLSRFVDEKKLKGALRKLARLEVGTRRLLFHEGLPLNIDLLLGRGAQSGAVEGKTRLSVVYLNTLHSAEDKEFLIASITDQLYGWMLKNPSKSPQALFYIDEVAPFIPPVRQTACKDSLMLIFKQARKYGLCCLMATQNPGDVDYKAMAQFGTWVIGRLTTRQDLKKIQPTLKSLDPHRVDELLETLPTLQAGEFVLISPDQFSESVDLRVRWLYSKHETLDEQAIEQLCDERWRAQFEALEAQLKGATEREDVALDESAGRGSLNPQASSSESAEPSDLTAGDALARSAERAPEERDEALDEEGEDEEGEDEEGEDEEDEDEHEARPVLDALAEAASLSVKELSVALSCSESKTRKTLKALCARGVLKSYKRGRSYHYYDPRRGARPDLELGAELPAILPKLTAREVEACVEVTRKKSSLISFGRGEERSLGHEQVYYLLYQVIFTEQVASGLWDRIVGQRSAKVEETIYLEPSTLKILVYRPGLPIELIDQPSDVASDIQDFDGVVEFGLLAPSELSLDEEAWLKRSDERLVRESISRRFELSIQEIRPILLPLWRARYQPLEGGEERVVYLDGVTGHPISF